MRILIFHGYLLRGTGSNVYNANVARALARLGHDVDLFCQDREAAALGWIDAVGHWRRGELEVEQAAGPGSPGSGSITAYVPEIGGLLPVYVADRYAGFEVKTFSAMSDAELDGYISANVEAVREVAARKPPDAALANHLIMGPVILARAGLRFASKVHGSALSYTVIPDSRFLPYAAEGMAASAGVLVGSGHTGRSLWETVTAPDLPAKTRLGPPGVDLTEFAPLPATVGATSHLRDVAVRIAALEAAKPPAATDDAESDSFARDANEAAAAIAGYAAATGPRVLFVGKTIVSKGCDLLLAAWPLVCAFAPGAHLLLAGFGAYRGGLESLWQAISSGDLQAARAIAAAGRGLEGGEGAPLPILSRFLENPPAGWSESALAAAGSVSFAGRLEHAEVAEVVRGSDALVVPSTFPEAFGMVAAEAAAAGAMPVCADHSGLAEVARALDVELPDYARGIPAFPLTGDPVPAIAERLRRWLELSGEQRSAAAEALTATTARLWSWEGVARGVIAASHGELDSLPAVPALPGPGGS